MSLPATAALWFLIFATPICVWVAWSDMKFMKIPNKAVLALFVVYAVVGFFTLDFGDYAWRYLHLVVILVAGFLLNALGMLGAGDAKFAAVMAPLIVWADAGRFMMLLAVCLLVAFVLHRIALRIPVIRRAAPDWKSWTEKKFPMGTALGLSMVGYLALAAF